MPGKVGRSPLRYTAEKQTDLIISALKFSVLILDEEEEGEIQEEKIFNKETVVSETNLSNTELQTFNQRSWGTCP